MTVNYFKKQFEFELWANTETAKALEKIIGKDDRAFFLFSHLLSSHSMWLSRLNATPFTTALFQERTLEESTTLMHENYAGWIKYFNAIDDDALQQVIHYTNGLTGIKERMVIADAITHILGHSSYHRGQIIARMKGLIDPLPLVTYIMFASEPDED